MAAPIEGISISDRFATKANKIRASMGKKVLTRNNSRNPMNKIKRLHRSGPTRREAPIAVK
jgi:hypothetical protein